MPRGSPSRSRTDYTAYEFTASAGFDYNYDPVGGRSSLHSNYLFDPYTDDYPSSPLIYQQDYNNSKGYDTSYDHVEPRYQYHQDTFSADTAVSYDRPEITPRPAPTPKVITEEYIRESEEPSQRIEDPSSCRKLLVLDLNGTLLFRSPHVRREYKPRYRRGFRGSNYHGHTPHLPDPDPYADPTTLRPLRSVYARPYLTSFRQYLFHPNTRLWLDTMVWSSAQPHSVTDMVEKCFGEKKDDLVAIWARDTLGLEEKDYRAYPRHTPRLLLIMPLNYELQTVKHRQQKTSQNHGPHFPYPHQTTPGPFPLLPLRNHNYTQPAPRSFLTTLLSRHTFSLGTIFAFRSMLLSCATPTWHSASQRKGD